MNFHIEEVLLVALHGGVWAIEHACRDFCWLIHAHTGLWVADMTQLKNPVNNR